MYPPRLGRVIGNLTVIRKISDSSKRDGRHVYLCRCSCGVEVAVNWGSLAKGHKKSCGCLVSARQARFAALSADGLSQRKHPLGAVYRGMIRRCHDEKHDAFQYYGGRGVTVCNRWRDSFQCFCDDVGARPSARHTLDRINPDGDYTPENVRWADRVEQAENQRVRLVVHTATLKGVRTTVAEWGRRLGLSDAAVARVKKKILSGDSPEHALVAAVYRKKMWASGGTDYAACEGKATRWLERNT